MNGLRRLLMGPGEFPPEVRAMLQSEGPVLIDEGLTGSITRRNYSGPGIRAKLERQGMTGAVAVIGQRVLVWAAGSKQIDPTGCSYSRRHFSHWRRLVM